MKLPDIPVINFYEVISDCFNFIHIQQYTGKKDFLRFGERRLAKGHPEVYELFRKEVAKDLDVDLYSGELCKLMAREYRCVGGGYMYAIDESDKYWKEGRKRQCWIRGRSSTYGDTDLNLVKRILEEDGYFDIVGIGGMPPENFEL